MQQLCRPPTGSSRRSPLIYVYNLRHFPNLLANERSNKLKPTNERARRNLNQTEAQWIQRRCGFVYRFHLQHTHTHTHTRPHLAVAAAFKRSASFSISVSDTTQSRFWRLLNWPSIWKQPVPLIYSEPLLRLSGFRWAPLLVQRTTFGCEPFAHPLHTRISREDSSWLSRLHF